MSRYERLQTLRVTTPCDQAWSAMEGDDQRRHCERCGHAVHNLAEMTQQEADQLLKSGGRPCVRITRDRRGRIVYRAFGFGALWAAVMAWMVFTANRARGEEPESAMPSGFRFFQVVQPQELTGKLAPPEEPK